MRTTKPLVAALAMAILGGPGSSATISAGQRPGAAGPGADMQAISAFNDCIQDRFKDIIDRFGVSRIVKLGETPHRFQPESVAEMGSVRALEQARLEVVLYVAGTRVLRPAPALPLVADAHAYAIIKGPVRVTAGSSPTDAARAPSASALREEGRRAMRAFATSESHEFTQSGWNFTARPVRASGTACLRCHQHANPATIQNDPVKLGDALGVVLYGYRAKR